MVVYTYGQAADADRKAQQINAKHANLKAEVFSPEGNRSPYLVVVGGAMSKDDAYRLRRIAVSQGMPHDSYAQNFSR